LGADVVKINRFEDLVAWQEARKLTNMVYWSCSGKDLSLENQIKRSAVSVMANIAEGFGRFGLRDSRQFYVTARGSVAETQSHLYVMLDSKYIDEIKFTRLYEQSRSVYKILNGLISQTVKLINRNSNN